MSSDGNPFEGGYDVEFEEMGGSIAGRFCLCNCMPVFERDAQFG